jgi:energy-coupling factor transporter transmembrane protein EcfT
MHAGSILLLWIAAVLLVQGADGGLLAAMVGVSLTVALAFARVRCARLLARVWVLLLVIGVLFAWFTPGEAVFVAWPRVSPSREGLLLALTHAGRLLAVVCWVAILLARMPADRLVSGLYALARPCVVFGLPAERVALRLLLVLRYVDVARKGGKAGKGGHDWRQWLLAPAADELEPVQLVRERPGFRDVALLTGVGCALAVWWLW